MDIFLIINMIINELIIINIHADCKHVDYTRQNQVVTRDYGVMFKRFLLLSLKHLFGSVIV